MRHYFNFLDLALIIIFLIQSTTVQAQQKFSKRQTQKIKTATLESVEDRHKNTQVMIDKVFSFAELGFQEYESSAYLTSILEESGFEIVKGISGILIPGGLCSMDRSMDTGWPFSTTLELWPTFLSPAPGKNLPLNQG